MAGTASPDVRRGGCQCGAVRYELRGPVRKVYVCHCRECRKQSASAFGVSVFVDRDSVRLTQGAPKTWSRPTDRGNGLECVFWPGCGSRLWHRRVGDATTISLKGGSLDDPPDLTDALHIWTQSRMRGVVVPEGATCWPQAPPP